MPGVISAGYTLSITKPGGVSTTSRTRYSSPRRKDDPNDRISSDLLDLPFQPFLKISAVKHSPTSVLTLLKSPGQWRRPGTPPSPC